MRLKEEQIKSKNVYLTINSSSIITRELIIPKVDMRKLKIF